MTLTYFLKIKNVNVNFSENVRASAKMSWSISRCRFCDLPSNGVIAKIVRFDLDLLFESETF